jgi:tetratricopeptide (TPR) repeat protein
MIDVQGMIRQASKRVSVDKLVQQGKKYISVLSKERIDELINQAVKNVADKYRALAAGVTGLGPDQVEAESRQEFQELLHTYQETAKAKSDLENSRQALDVELDELRKDLEKQKALADGRLSEEAEKALIIGFKEFERELDKQVVKVFEKRKLILQDSENPDALAELKGVENAIRPIISRLVSAERERFRMSGGQSRETAMLEKRIEKLYAQIGALEAALKTITSSKVYSNQQIQNVLRQLGLAQEDKNFEKKKEMLKVVLSANKDIRSKSKALEEKGITLANAKGLEEAVKALPSAPPEPAAAPPSPNPQP